MTTHSGPASWWSVRSCVQTSRAWLELEQDLPLNHRRGKCPSTSIAALVATTDSICYGHLAKPTKASNVPSVGRRPRDSSHPSRPSQRVLVEPQPPLVEAAPAGVAPVLVAPPVEDKRGDTRCIHSNVVRPDGQSANFATLHPLSLMVYTLLNCLCQSKD